MYKHPSGTVPTVAASAATVTAAATGAATAAGAAAAAAAAASGCSAATAAPEGVEGDSKAKSLAILAMTLFHSDMASASASSTSVDAAGKIVSPPSLPPLEYRRRHRDGRYIPVRTKGQGAMRDNKVLQHETILSVRVHV